MIESIITLILNTKARQISKYEEENKKLRRMLSELCEGCLRGAVIFHDRRSCSNCPIGEVLKRGEEKVNDND